MESRDREAKRLFGELWLTMNDITRGIEAELKPFGLTHAQFQVILTVLGSPGISQRELAERLNVTTGNVSMLVSKLTRAGLLERVSAGAAFHLHVTDAGREAFDSLRGTRERFLANLFEPVSLEQIRAAADVLRAIRRR